jgi:hypothetical protein
MLYFSWFNLMCIAVCLWGVVRMPVAAQTNLLQGKWICIGFEDTNTADAYFIEIDGSTFSYNTEEISDKGTKPILIAQAIVELRMATGSDNSGMLFTQDKKGEMHLYTFTKISHKGLIFNDPKISGANIGELMELYEQIVNTEKQNWATRYPNEPFPVNILETGLIFHEASFYAANQALPTISIDTPEACVAWIEKVSSHFPAQVGVYTRLGGFFMYLYYSQIIVEAGMANQVNPYHLSRALNKSIDQYRDQGNQAVLNAMEAFQKKLTGQ